MSAPEYRECGCRKLLADHETWHIILDPAFCNDPSAANSLAHLLFVLKKAIASGPEGSSYPRERVEEMRRRPISLPYPGPDKLPCA
jgi:hypothetical protein